jgi:hypothetical protein
MVAVAAYLGGPKSGIGIRQDGTLEFTGPGGGDFDPIPVSSGGVLSYRPITPEEAAAHVADLTGAKVTRVPRLLLKDARYHPSSAQWEVALDRPVRVRRASGGAEESVTTLYVGQNRKVTLPSAVQPEAVSAQLITGPVRRRRVGKSVVREAAPSRTVEVRRAPGVPAQFDQVTVLSVRGDSWTAS